MTMPLADIGREMFVPMPFARLMLSERRDIWCLVDADDYSEWIVQRRYNVGWHASTPWKFYAKRNVGPERSTVYLHREIMIRADPRTEIFQWTHHVDHINGQSLDNRKVNLRWLTPGENRTHRIPRASIPSLEKIVKQIMADALAGAADAAAEGRVLEEVPF